jgi:hypothetical protein
LTAQLLKYNPLRDFIDTIADDPTRDSSHFVEIQTDINIFEEDGFYSPNIVVELVHARIHTYMTRGQGDAQLQGAHLEVGVEAARELDVLEVVDDRVEESGDTDDESHCLGHGQVFKLTRFVLRGEKRPSKRGNERKSHQARD